MSELAEFFGNKIIYIMAMPNGIHTKPLIKILVCSE